MSGARTVGEHLVAVHTTLRGQLAELRARVADGQSPPLELREFCLTWCASLHAHHTGEDAVAFPMLRERHPELAPVLDRLRRDHVVVEELQERLRRTLDEPGPGTLAVVDTLTGLLEAHFAEEEARLMDALDGLPLPS
ncbi:hemerythrin domain-containing protein [Nonomuraea longicatena]|uniref:Hemerythrin-like domain-containing protein n=1 Tax=Nonomuraea longicatena TaxID=83682 RepID=A0ABP3ZAB0_9ACTN